MTSNEKRELLCEIQKRIKDGTCQVLGAGVSNLPLIRWLLSKGAEVVVRDMKSADKIDGAEEIISLGLKGVKIHPDIQKVQLDDPRMHKMYELCEGRLPMLIHTGDCRYDNSNPNRLIPILEKYPNLTVIGAHFGGWSIWEEATEKLYGFKNFLVDCSSSLYAITPEKAKELILAYGTDRVLFGTDYPLWSPEVELERFMQIDLTDEQREEIFYSNTARLFFK